MIGTVGFALVAAPIHISERHAPPGTIKPLRQTLMLYEDGRVHQQQWVGAKTQWEGFWINVKYGLGTFNNTVMDHAWIYKNAGHGFADPLTGILLWLGAGVVGVGLVRRRAGPGALLMLLSFVVLWLSFAFIVNEAPNYTRLLVVVPFSAYLVTEGVRWLAGRWSSVRYAPAAIAAGTSSRTEGGRAMRSAAPAGICTRTGTFPASISISSPTPPLRMRTTSGACPGSGRT